MTESHTVKPPNLRCVIARQPSCTVFNLLQVPMHALQMAKSVAQMQLLPAVQSAEPSTSVSVVQNLLLPAVHYHHSVYSSSYTLFPDAQLLPPLDTHRAVVVAPVAVAGQCMLQCGCSPSLTCGHKLYYAADHNHAPCCKFMAYHKALKHTFGASASFQA